VFASISGMNEISFVVAPDEFGPGVADGLEPVIDGVSLVDVLKWADGEIWHAGLVAIEHALHDLRKVPAPGASRVVQVLGCTCGDDQCSPVTTTVSATYDAITWSGIHARRQTHADIGPFRFSPSACAAAVATPVRLDSRSANRSTSASSRPECHESPHHGCEP
jgi:hypothetical protein